MKSPAFIGVCYMYNSLFCANCDVIAIIYDHTEGYVTSRNHMDYNTKGKVLKKAVVWKELYFYRKSDALYQITVDFCKRFLPAHGDRTVDQMV